MRLQDKVAVVTGGANGIGKATVRALAAEGAAVVIADFDRQRSAQLVEELGGAGKTVVYEFCDLTDSGSVKQMIEATIARFGRVDILANIAGGSGLSPFYKTPAGQAQKWTEDIPEAEWDNTIAINLTAPFYTLKHALPYMKKAGRGTIVNFSSVGADHGFADSSFAYAAYAAAKAGIIGFTHQLARELGPFGITANCVSPGAVTSERMQERWEKDPRWREESDRTLRDVVPLRRRASTDEVAACVVFLASADASYVSGITLDVNGGRYMR
ncbi:MAG: SDR family oxidoreductase [Chloroflexi bacterium]|nr:SDR family oxidoreductase [Chloroflexota bacterium]